jgi:hypothetical protein
MGEVRARSAQIIQIRLQRKMPALHERRREPHLAPLLCQTEMDCRRLLTARRGSSKMNPLRTTVIMKTDISGSTSRFRELLTADLQALLASARFGKLASARQSPLLSLRRRNSTTNLTGLIQDLPAISRRFLMVITQEPAQPLATLHSSLRAAGWISPAGDLLHPQFARVNGDARANLIARRVKSSPLSPNRRLARHNAHSPGDPSTRVAPNFESHL